MADVGYLVVGLSHRAGSLAAVERAALTEDEIGKLIDDLCLADDVAEAAVLATCNRLEVHADVSRFHGGIDRICELLARHTDRPLAELTADLYAHYDEAAVRHVFSVASGLDSLVVGESEILGQVRAELRTAQASGSLGSALNALLQKALRVGKRVQTETDLGRAGRSLVSVGLQTAADHRGDLTGAAVLVVGAGTVGALAARAAVRLGAGRVVLANRTESAALALADTLGVHAVSLAALGDELIRAEVVVTCTSAPAPILTVPLMRAPLAVRDGRPLFVLDLAMPRDTEPALAELPGVTVCTLDDLAGPGFTTAGVEAATAVVEEELATFLAERRTRGFGSTVAALRGLADEVVETEMRRLRSRLPDCTPETLAEIRMTLSRAVDKLVHAPTVRVKELGVTRPETDYAAALRELFALDPRVIDAVTGYDPGYDLGAGLVEGELP